MLVVRVCFAEMVEASRLALWSRFEEVNWLLGAQLLWGLLELACDESRQSEQVVGGAAEDADPVDVGQASQFT